MTRHTRSSSLPPLPARILAPLCLAAAIVLLTLVVMSSGGSGHTGTSDPAAGWGADQTASAH